MTEKQRVNVAESDAMLAASADPAHRAKAYANRPPPAQHISAAVAEAAAAREAAAAGDMVAPAASPSAADNYTRVRVHREAFNAKSAEAVYRKMIGELVERAEYARGLAQNLGPALQRLDTLSARIGVRLAAEADPRRIQEILDSEVRSVRQEIANYADALIAGVEGTKQ